jgi:hypothetical protein
LTEYLARPGASDKTLADDCERQLAAGSTVRVWQSVGLLGFAGYPDLRAVCGFSWTDGEGFFRTAQDAHRRNDPQYF